MFPRMRFQGLVLTCKYPLSKSAGAAGAASVLAKFNAMLKAKKAAAQQPEDHSTEAARRRDPDATDYHAIVWINDYPQKARWKVTNKETMVHVSPIGLSILVDQDCLI